MTGNCPLIHHYAICTVENMPLNTQHISQNVFVVSETNIKSLPTWWSRGKELAFRAESLGFKLNQSSADCPYVKPLNLCAYGKRRFLPWFESLNNYGSSL